MSNSIKDFRFPIESGNLPENPMFASLSIRRGLLLWNSGRYPMRFSLSRTLRNWRFRNLKSPWEIHRTVHNLSGQEMPKKISWPRCEVPGKICSPYPNEEVWGWLSSQQHFLGGFLEFQWIEWEIKGNQVGELKDFWWNLTTEGRKREVEMC